MQFVASQSQQPPIRFLHYSGSTVTIDGDTNDFFVRKIGSVVYLDGLGITMEVKSTVTGINIRRSDTTITFTCLTGNYLHDNTGQATNTPLNFHRNHHRFGIWNEPRSSRQRFSRTHGRRGRLEQRTQINDGSLTYYLYPHYYFHPNVFYPYY